MIYCIQGLRVLQRDQLPVTKKKRETNFLPSSHTFNDVPPCVIELMSNEKI